MSTMYTIWCVIVDENIPFQVKIASNETVAILKEAIKEKGKNTFANIDARQLDLYHVEIPDNEDVATVVEQNLLDLPAKLSPRSNMVDIFGDSPNRTDFIIVQPPKSATENQIREGHHYAPVDVTHSLLQRWPEWSMQLPPMSGLIAHVQQPLRDDEKVPVMERDISKLVTEGSPTSLCTRGELEQLVKPSDVEEASYIWLVMKSAITLDAPAESGTEASFISFWDRNIRTILETVVASSRTIRDSNQHTNTGLLRPDFGFLVDGNCVFRGEEEPPRYSGTHPKDELGNKLVWTYEPAPYLLGYYAIGSGVTLVAITATSVIDLIAFDLSYKAQRIKFVVCLLRLSSLLKPLATLVGHRADPELETLDRPGGKTVSIGARAIMKTFQDPGHELHAAYLKAIYENLKEKEVPNVDRPTTWYLQPTKSVVYLEPKGRNRLPGSGKEVRNAAGCILEALMIMHSEPKPMFHRDIRWPNVIQRADSPERWFLIDWDDATLFPTRASPHLSAAYHSPRVFQDGHGAEVDLWAVGRMIYEAGEFVPGVSPEMMAFAERLVKGEVTSAGQALDVLRQFRGET